MYASDWKLLFVQPVSPLFFFLLRRRLDVSSQSRQMIKIVQSVNISSNQTLTSACLSKVWLCKASQQLAS